MYIYIYVYIYICIYVYVYVYIGLNLNPTLISNPKPRGHPHTHMYISICIIHAYAPFFLLLEDLRTSEEGQRGHANTHTRGQTRIYIIIYRERDYTRTPPPYGLKVLCSY